jgi:pilus assembly protein CpaF
MEGDVVTMQEIFTFERRGLSEQGKVRGAFKATGIRPKFTDKLAAAGIRLPPSLFETEVVV